MNSFASICDRLKRFLNIVLLADESAFRSPLFCFPCLRFAAGTVIVCHFVSPRPPSPPFLCPLISPLLTRRGSANVFTPLRLALFSCPATPSTNHPTPLALPDSPPPSHNFSLGHPCYGSFPNALFPSVSLAPPVIELLRPISPPSVFPLF